jgi:hypothetical protein
MLNPLNSTQDKHHSQTLVSSFECTGLFKMTVGVLANQTKKTSDRRISIFLFNRTTLQVFVTYLTGTLYVHPL